MLNMLDKYGMLDCKSISVPLDQNGKVSADVGRSKYVKEDGG